MKETAPILFARVGEPLPLTAIAAECPSLDEQTIKRKLESQIREHFSLYGTEPYRIEYSRAIGSYQLRPTAVVGLINCGDFILQISSKFKNIEVGKWLQLAHRSQATNLVNHNNDITESAVSDQDALSGMDYFVLGLVSATYDCINQGLLYKTSVWTGDDPNFNGKLSLAHHVKEGANPYNLQTTQNKKDFNCLPNSIILTALLECISKCKSEKLRGLCDGLLSNFKDIESVDVGASSIEYEYVSSLPRPDYEKALALAKIILEGFPSTEGDTESFVPFFTINLDLLFETYVAFEMKAMIKDEFFEVISQLEAPHPFEPELEGNFISPDLVVIPTEEPGNRKVVLDTKNKYSLVDTTGAPKISNSDIYQMAYYCTALDSNIAILIYPGDSENNTSYPIPSSEGKAQYVKKQEKAIKKIFETGSGFKVSLDGLKTPIYLFAWKIDLSGTLHDTRASLAELCQFTADCALGAILAD